MVHSRGKKMRWRKRRIAEAVAPSGFSVSEGVNSWLIELEGTGNGLQAQLDSGVLTVPAELGLASSSTSASLCVGFTRAGFPQRQLLHLDA